MECQEDCQETQDCNYFSFSERNNFCTLFYNCTVVDTEVCPDCFSSQKDCPQYVCSEPGHCEGIVIGNAFLNSENECIELCYNDIDCLWYTYDNDAQFCYLTSNCITKNTTTSQVYGQKQCFELVEPNPSRFSCEMYCQLNPRLVIF